MLYYFNIALLTLRFSNVQLFDIEIPDIVPFNVALFNVRYLMFYVFMLQCLMLH